MRTRGCRVKPIGEILRFVGHQSFAEFHDAHRVRWYAVIGKYEFSDPEIAAADNSPDRKTLLVWLDESALLNVVPAANPLARLRIIKHSILAVDFMFDIEIARVRGIPMALQRHPHGSIIHLNLPFAPGFGCAQSRYGADFARRANQFVFCRLACPAPFAKIFLFRPDPNQFTDSHRPVSTRGADRASSRTRGGMRWTRQRQAMSGDGRAGR